MAERRTIFKKTLSYNGIFSITDFYQFLDEWCKDKNYDKDEKLNEELIEEGGKNIRLWYEPYKKTTDYAMLLLKIRVYMTDVKEVTVDFEGQKRKLNKGHVKFSIEGILVTDYETKMENKPFYFFIKTLFDRYIYKVYTDDYVKELAEDAEILYSSVSKFLNFYRDRTGY